MKLFPVHIYQQRRDTLRDTLQRGLVLLPGNVESSMNYRDNHYPFRQDSTFLYYCGLDHPGLVFLLDLEENKTLLFGDELSIDDIVWTGPLPKLVDLAAQVGISKVLPMKRLPNYLAGNKDRVHALPPYRPEHRLQLSAWLDIGIEEVPGLVSPALIEAVVAQRSVKDHLEIVELDFAVSLSVAMHQAVMQAAQPGLKGHQLVGIAANVAASAGAQFSFPPILTTRGQTLHTHDYGDTLKDGDMLLFDGGIASEMHYAGDLTRTFPVGVRFDSRQEALYQIVLQAQQAAIDALKPGTPYKELHRLASKTLVEGLIGMGLMKGDPDEAVAAGAHTLVFPCGLGHMMGLDVHDMENLGEEYVGYTPEMPKRKDFGWKSLRLGRALEPGFVLTVEPGIYMIPELIELRKAEKAYEGFVNYPEFQKFKDFGGIRIEDDYLITQDGARLLGKPLAKSLDDLYRIRAATLSPS